MSVPKKKVSFTENADDITIQVDDSRVEFHADGSILVYTNNAVRVSPVANDDGKPAASVEPKPGDNAVPCIGHRMPDGTIYAGISPDTGKPMYATPADAPLTMTFNDAVSYAKKLDAHGHTDWHVPTKGELNVLFNNRAAIGGFNVSGSDPAGWYWSGTKGLIWCAWDLRFSDGCQSYTYKDGHSSVRCVR